MPCVVVVVVVDDLMVPLNHQALVVQKVDSAILRINHFPADRAVFNNY